MPYGGNDWLALTQEPTLEPEIPICDPHHHFWDFRSERTPYQRYLLHELAADVNCGHNDGMRPESQVRTGLRAGARWIRTCGPAQKTSISSHRDGAAAGVQTIGYGDRIALAAVLARGYRARVLLASFT
jgi:hypothetical protein